MIQVRSWRPCIILHALRLVLTRHVPSFKVKVKLTTGQGTHTLRLLVPNVASIKRGRWWPCFTISCTSSGDDRHSLKSVKYPSAVLFGMCRAPAPAASTVPGPADASAWLPPVAPGAPAAVVKAAAAPAPHMPKDVRVKLQWID